MGNPKRYSKEFQERAVRWMKLAVLLQREGYVAGAKTVRRLMREDSLLAIRRRRFVVTTNSDHRFQVWPNLAQYLELTDINQF